MGNNVLAECRTGISDQTDNNYLPTLTGHTCNNSLNKKHLKNSQQHTLQIQSRQQQQQPRNLSSLQILKIPQRSQQIQIIYQSLIKQKPIQYSIQRKQYLSYFDVQSLKQLIEKMTKYKTTKKDTQTNKISLSSPQLKKINIQQTLTNIQVTPYKFQTQKINDISLDKISYRERSLSKSFDINQQQIYDDKNNKKKNNPSLYDHTYFHITNKTYVYIGHVNAQNIPHGPGQLYNLHQVTQNNDNSNNLTVFIQAEFINGSIYTNDALIINQNRSYYRGGFDGSIIHGKGKLCQNDGLILQGNFINGLLQGKAKATYPDLGTYEGYFHQGLREGKGIMTWKSQQQNSSTNTPLSITYDGYFKFDQMQGLGYLKTPNYQYWGPFVFNMKQGKGTLKFNDGKKYQGWFQKDQINGYGQLHYPDGFVQKGIFPISKQQ